jgi:hypothetical protein
MKKKRLKSILENKLVLWIIVLIIGVFFFALVYYLCFQFNTSSFIIDPQYNQKINRINTIQDEYDLYTIEDREEIPFTIDEYNSKIRHIHEELIQTRIIDSITNRLKIIDDSLNYLCSIIELSREYETQKYVREKSQIIKDSIKIQTKLIDSIDKIEHKNSKLFELLQAQYIKLNYLEYTLAKINLESYQYILDHYSGFGNEEYKNCYSELQNAQIQLLVSYDSVKQSRRTIYNNLSDLNSTFHNNRKEKVNYLDFCYYSMLIATSNNFGEIRPNNLLTRVWTIIELLFLFTVYMKILNAITNK